MSAFGMGGWWLGGTHMVPNGNFIGEVQQKVRTMYVYIVGSRVSIVSPLSNH
jgi:hypothetical protein